MKNKKAGAHLRKFHPLYILETIKFQNVMTKVVNFIEKTAINFAKKKSIAHEWYIAIGIFAILKLATNIIGIYAGYFYMFSVVSRFLDEIPSKIISGGLLGLIEFLTVYILIRAFKLVAKGNWQIGLTALFSSLVMYSFSFYIATTGLALEASTKVTKQAEILKNSDASQTDVNAKYEMLSKRIDEQIEEIRKNPQGWKDNKLVRLMDWQLFKIDSLNKELRNIEAERMQAIALLKENTESTLKEDHAETQKAAKDYWNFTAGVMIVQFFSTMALAFFYVSIRKELEPELHLAEEVTIVQSQIVEKQNESLLNTYKQQSHYLTLALANGEKKVKEAPQKDKQPERIKIKTLTPSQNNGESINSESINGERLNGERSNSTDTTNSTGKICLHCGSTFHRKHWAALYCDDNCKKAHWEAKTGITLKYKSKKV